MTRQEELSALDAWLTLHAIAMSMATLVAAVMKSGAPIALVGALSFALCGVRSRRALAQLRPYGGYANHLTALRLTAVLCAAALLTDISREWLFVIFGANVLLDVADGYAAQRASQTSELGTMFDREADATFVLVAYTYFFCISGVGVWILLPGLLPYLYHLFARAAHETPTRQRKQRLAAVLAGVNYGCLLVAVALPASLQATVLAVSTAIVTFSFAVSFSRLYRGEHSFS